MSFHDLEHHRETSATHKRELIHPQTHNTPCSHIQLAAIDDAGQFEHYREPSTQPDTLTLGHRRAVFPLMLDDQLQRIPGDLM